MHLQCLPYVPQALSFPHVSSPNPASTSSVSHTCHKPSFPHVSPPNPACTPSVSHTCHKLSLSLTFPHQTLHAPPLSPIRATSCLPHVSPPNPACTSSVPIRATSCLPHVSPPNPPCISSVSHTYHKLSLSLTFPHQTLHAPPVSPIRATSCLFPSHFPTKTCLHLQCLTYVPHALSPQLFCSTTHEASLYTLSYILMLLPLSEVQMPSWTPCPVAPSACVRPSLRETVFDMRTKQQVKWINIPSTVNHVKPVIS